MNITCYSSANNYAEAIAELKTAKTVDQWNEIRATWMPMLSKEEVGKIDGSGLIVEVLGEFYYTTR